MAEAAVRVEGLGKYYYLGARARPGEAQLREVLTRLFVSPLAKLVRRYPSASAPSLSPASARRPDSNHIWALRDVSFGVPHGQLLGIVGPNGAGKSTLLKILARITEPTEGRAELRGRIASLLEVGVGFHPELTGRENIYLSGALLGMKRAEIRARFDEIIAFAEVEKFVDTPVKHYSSGMYVRLAFAVAAHLEPEILIVDEVLAVGDMAFQRKCINKMEDVRQHGRTILFVSHNMPVIARLCQRAILISDGRVQRDGPSAEVVGAYLLEHLQTSPERDWPDAPTAPGDDVARLRKLRIYDEFGDSRDTVDVRRPVTVEMTYDVRRAGCVLWPYLVFSNQAGVCVFVTRDLDPEWRGRTRPVGRFVSRVQIPGNFLAEGVLLVSGGLYSNPPFRIHFFGREAIAFHISDAHEGDSAKGDWQGEDPGVVRPLLAWNSAFEPAAATDPDFSPRH